MKLLLVLIEAVVALVALYRSRYIAEGRAVQVMRLLAAAAVAAFVLTLSGVISVGGQNPPGHAANNHRSPKQSVTPTPQLKRAAVYGPTLAEARANARRMAKAQRKAFEAAHATAVQQEHSAVRQARTAYRKKRARERAHRLARERRQQEARQAAAQARPAPSGGTGSGTAGSSYGTSGGTSTGSSPVQPSRTYTVPAAHATPRPTPKPELPDVG